ncbi:DeoR faimly transcriptional regulator [Lentzea aerocolonigenes]|uniref:DeoR faimly transcriptional regulator n=1 Tax=Lentzea aerocolonigenes TaxID=68170 RepID=A0A0F0GFI3_LENAE|nr:alpha/beta hydrolase [Lentzea aerocolonigenes]KJK33349.1 DeoR faimly transcriptional regulator [Lentzea aerocolonigenes]
METVTFPSNGLDIAGHLYRPEGEPRGAIVVGHPGSGVKEQSAGTYAKQLADQGFLALAFDAAYQGESAGEPRGLEDPAQRVEDIRAAVTFLGTENAGVLGICASGGYGLAAAGTDQRIKAIATVSLADVARQFRFGADGTQDPAVLQGMLAHGQDGSFPLVPETEEQARQTGPHAYDGWEYYCTPRAEHPRAAKTFTWNSVGRITAFDAFRTVDLITPRPVLFVVGRDAVTSWMTVEAYQKAAGPKEIHWIEGAGHVDLYDRYVPQVAGRVTEFFGKNL